MVFDIIYIIAAYLFGSLPHLKWLARIRSVRLEGDFHQDLYSRAGAVTGVAGVIGEFIKGATPVLVGKAIDLPAGVVAAAGLAAVCGQMWPAFSRFDGEKGNSIAVAMTLALVPYAALYGLIPVVIALIFRTIPRFMKNGGGVLGDAFRLSLPLGMILCFMIIPFAAWQLGEPWPVVACLIALFILMIVIRRLTAGLKQDIASGAYIGDIIARRLLYDRATVNWRKQSFAQ